MPLDKSTNGSALGRFGAREWSKRGGQAQAATVRSLDDKSKLLLLEFQVHNRTRIIAMLVLIALRRRAHPLRGNILEDSPQSVSQSRSTTSFCTAYDPLRSPELTCPSRLPCRVPFLSSSAGQAQQVAELQQIMRALEVRLGAECGQPSRCTMHNSLTSRMSQIELITVIDRRGVDEVMRRDLCGIAVKLLH